MSDNIPKEHVKAVCLGGNKGACAYLTAGSGGWMCAKDSPEIKAAIDQRLKEGSMTATGDYCSGLNPKEEKELN